ncbi:hypothetical protein STSP2_01468 [Anaerohalosphaera lusitana]|uniref:Helix-turn-helix domain-containing protein n=1 Tax=Anaerohalosphaera lusitana TaxID=1936003 RepID=A0A1U9NK73_9BACT|nr:MarR family transcriptional regulator [Anaerohalosphaera lusitana]AQT68309.1 hypothetical protein STSP2_01468 [Anaerohalosphaera lusitana]
MGKLDHIRIPREVLKFGLKGSHEICIMGLIYSFGRNGLMLTDMQLANFLHTSSRTVERALKKLRDRGFVVSKRAAGCRRRLVVGPAVESVHNAGSAPDALGQSGSDMDPGVTDPRSGGWPVSSPDILSVNTDVTAGFNPTSMGDETDVTAGQKESNKMKVEEESSAGRNSHNRAFVDYWNAKENLPVIRAFSDQRQNRLKVRMSERVFADNWREAIDKLSASSFATGHNDRAWRADVDWLLKNSTNYIKVLEGKYDDRDLPGPVKGAGDTKQEFTPEMEEAFLAENTRTITDSEAKKLFEEIGLA